MTGKVKWFNNKLGYGFLVDESNTDYFVYYKDIKTDDKYKILKPNQEVTFETETDNNGKTKAINVTKK